MVHKNILIITLLVMQMPSALKSMEEKETPDKRATQSIEYQADQIQRCLACCLNNGEPFCPDIDQAFRIIEQIPPTTLIQSEPLIKKLIDVALHYKTNLGSKSSSTKDESFLTNLMYLSFIGSLLYITIGRSMYDKPLSTFDLWIPALFICKALYNLAENLADKDNYRYSATDLESIYAMIKLTYRRLQEQNDVDDDTRNYINKNLCNQVPIPATLVDLCTKLKQKEDKLD